MKATSIVYLAIIAGALSLFAHQPSLFAQPLVEPTPLSVSAPSPDPAPPTEPASHPKLAVVIALDQFPFEYLDRFGPYFSDRGFNYLMSHGAVFTNARYEHAATKTAPGHAAIMTGTYGHVNGITSNRWYDRQRKKAVNAVDDPDVQILGTGATGRSPKNLLTYTFGDMLRVGSNFRSKVISLSNKDRSAILMGGKLGEAFWFEDSVITTSTYYHKAAPAWMKSFNASGTMQRFAGKEWTEQNPSAAAIICDRDDARYEADPARLGRTFPHLLPGTSPGRANAAYYDAVSFTPFSTEILIDAVRKVVAAESLGTRGVTDMLCVGISATDIIGHEFGPASHEVFDNALLTDSMLAGFLSFLDRQVGLKNCVIAVTSDHGVTPIPEYLKSRAPRVDAGRIGSAGVTRLVSRILDARFGKGATGTKWIEQLIDSDIYLDRDVLTRKNISFGDATQALKDSLPILGPFAEVYTRDEIERSGALGRFGTMVRNSFHLERSGDVTFVLKPFYVNGGDSVGTGHGQPEDYDSHVPVIFLGPEFKPGMYRMEVSPIDLAPTMSEVLQVEYPPSREGRVLYEAIR